MTSKTKPETTTTIVSGLFGIYSLSMTKLKLILYTFSTKISI